MTQSMIRRFQALRERSDAGMSTAEYAVGILTACTFAIILLGIVKSGPVKDALLGIVQRALGLAG